MLDNNMGVGVGSIEISYNTTNQINTGEGTSTDSVGGWAWAALDGGVLQLGGHHNQNRVKSTHFEKVAVIFYRQKDTTAKM